MPSLSLLLPTFLIVPLVVVACGQLGLFSGHAPSDLGVRNGMLKAPALGATNVVSSYAARQGGSATNQIEPLHFSGDGHAAFDKLTRIVGAMNGIAVIQTEPTYLYAQATTPILKFIDDVEFVLDAPAGVIQMRSASRLGKKDFGANRKRLEIIRLRFGS